MRHAIFLAMVFLASTTSFADNPEREAAAAKLLEVSRASAMIDAVYDSFEPQFRAMADQLGIEEDQRPIFDRHMQRTLAVLREEINWEKMSPYMIAAYADVYTADEMIGLAEFYESPLGQKYLDKMPELMAASMSMTQEMMGGFYARLEGLQAELIADIAASKEQDGEE